MTQEPPHWSNGIAFGSDWGWEQAVSQFSARLLRNALLLETSSLRRRRGALLGGIGPGRIIAEGRMRVACLRVVLCWRRHASRARVLGRVRCTTIDQIVELESEGPRQGWRQSLRRPGLGEVAFGGGPVEDQALNYVCGKVGTLASAGIGITAAAASAETGPGAVAIGVTTYKRLDTLFVVSCSFINDQAFDLGVWFESKYKEHVRTDVIPQGKCLRYRTVFGLNNWAAMDCP